MTARDSIEVAISVEKVCRKFIATLKEMYVDPEVLQAAIKVAESRICKEAERIRSENAQVEEP